MKFDIRGALPADGQTVANYNSRMAEETEGKSLDSALIDAGVAALLADASKGRYWLAEAEGQIIGQIMVTYEWSDWRNGNIWWIQSVYIHPDWRRNGVFSGLYRHVESLATTSPQVVGLRLYVEDNNKRAQQTYEALGMIKPNYLVMESMLDKKEQHKGGDS